MQGGEEHNTLIPILRNEGRMQMSKYLNLREAWSGLDQEFITGQLKEKRE